LRTPSRDEEARTLNRTRLETIAGPTSSLSFRLVVAVIPSCLLIGDPRDRADPHPRGGDAGQAATPAKPTEWDRAEAQRLGRARRPRRPRAGGRRSAGGSSSTGATGDDSRRPPHAAFFHGSASKRLDSGS